MQKHEVFPLSPPDKSTWLWLWIPLLFSAAVIVAGLQSGYQGSVLHIPLLAVPATVLIGAGLSWMMRRRHIRLDNRELRITATLYTRKVAVEAIDLAHARVVSLDERTDLKPRF